MSTTSVTRRSADPYAYQPEPPSLAERVFDKAKEFVPAPIRKVAWAVSMPIYMGVAFASVGAVIGGTVGGLGGPLGLIAGGLSGAGMGGSIGTTLGAQIALVGLSRDEK
ncbi:MAG: hypothetical protein IT381_11080 [Deltaproteobacteria bacterium]|nr:hypothetical protein [Deltaproteobacteria bacterium]